MKYKGEIQVWCSECNEQIGVAMGAHELVEIEREHRDIYGHSKFIRTWGEE